MQGVTDLNGISRHQYPCRSEVWFVTGNGVASSGTGVRVYTTLNKFIGNSLRPIMDPVNGWGVQVNVDGVYAVTVQERFSAGGAYDVILNTTSNAVAVTAPYAQTIMSYSVSTANAIIPSTTITNLKAGDIVYVSYTTGSLVDTGAANTLRVTQVA